jgi:hypothetical protein
MQSKTDHFGSFTLGTTKLENMEALASLHTSKYSIQIHGKTLVIITKNCYCAKKRQGCHFCYVTSYIYALEHNLFTFVFYMDFNHDFCS